MQTSHSTDATPQTLAATLATSDVPVVVNVTAGWCNPCHRLAASLPKLAHQFAGRACFVSVDADDNPQLLKLWEVDSFPQLLLFREGIVIDRSCGFLGHSQLEGWISRQIAHSETRSAMDEAAERHFQDAAGTAEATYDAATLPAAEALGSVLEPHWPAHEAFIKQVKADHAAGRLSPREASRAAEDAQAKLTQLAGPELAEQRRVTALAVTEYLAAMRHATRVFLGGGACSDTSDLAGVTKGFCFSDTGIC